MFRDIPALGVFGAAYFTDLFDEPPVARHDAEHMKSYREELTFETKTRRAYINITQQVEAAVKKSGVKEGLCLVKSQTSGAASSAGRQASPGG